MKQSTLPDTVAQTFCPVKSSIPSIPSIPSNPMIHHKVTPSRIVGNTLDDIIERGKRYGVSSSHKVLTKGLLLKKFDLVRDCLAEVCELTPAERDVALQLLRMQAYYPQVYPKATQMAAAVNHGVATFWRTVGRLQDANLLKVVNRFLIRVEAQISNLYLLDELIILIARYLAEHGVAFWQKWLKPYLTMPGSQFWSQTFLTPGDRVVPWRLALEGL